MMGCAYIERVNEMCSTFDEKELDDICASLMCHHGEWSVYGEAELQTTEDYILHLADMVDSQIVGLTESGKGGKRTYGKRRRK